MHLLYNNPISVKRILLKNILDACKYIFILFYGTAIKHAHRRSCRYAWGGDQSYWCTRCLSPLFAHCTYSIRSFALRVKMDAKKIWSIFSTTALSYMCWCCIHSTNRMNNGWHIHCVCWQSFKVPSDLTSGETALCILFIILFHFADVCRVYQTMYTYIFHKRVGDGRYVE